MRILHGTIISYIRRHALTLIPYLTFARTYNILLALLERQLKRVKCKSRPFIYRIDPCTTCNLRCPGCEAHSIKHNEKKLLDLKDFQTIVRKVHRLCLRISLYDTGEPLLNKNIYKMIRYAGDYNASTSLSTHFNLFNKHTDLKKLFQSRLTVLQPSLDGVTQESYSIYRIGGQVSLIKDGIEAVVEHKKKTGKKLPFVDVQVILLDHLSDKKEDIQEYLNQVGVDQITWKHDTWGYNKIETTFDEVRTKRKQTNEVCYWLYLGVMIRPDGQVYPCTGKGFDRLSYGNILEQSIDEIWNNKYFQFSRSLFIEGETLEYSKEFEHIPCLDCKAFYKKRTMRTKPRI